MAKGDATRGRFSRWRLFFKILKMRTNQQPDIYIIPKAYPNPYPKPNHNLGML